MLNDHPVTVGGDCTSRLWKIADQKQLVFRGQKASIDCLSIIHDEAYVSGAQDGSVALWSTQKKKPTFVVDRAHRFETPMPGWSSDTPWVSSVAVIRNTDLCFSGSCNGFLNAYRIQDTKLTRLPRIAMVSSSSRSSSSPFLFPHTFFFSNRTVSSTGSRRQRARSSS